MEIALAFYFGGLAGFFIGALGMRRTRADPWVKAVPFRSSRGPTSIDFPACTTRGQARAAAMARLNGAPSGRPPTRQGPGKPRRIRF